MARKSEAETAAAIELLCRRPNARLIPDKTGRYTVRSDQGDHGAGIGRPTLRRLCASGLLIEQEPDIYVAAPVARAWLRRQRDADRPFRVQHGEIALTRDVGDRDREVLVNLDESPIAALCRRSGKDGIPWLSADLAAAAQRLRRDFEIGRLQPRVTANWSASINDGRRRGDSSGLTDLTEMALAARVRFDRAMHHVGPELSGILVDVCCFLKGLETVERERRWPARSAKLVLRLALQSLARHYGLMPLATGKGRSGKLRHWGADGFRPTVT